MRKLIALLLWWPVWAGAATSVAAGTDLTGVFNSSGEYELQDGTHTISANFTTAADVVVTATDGAVLRITPNVVFEFRDGFELNGVFVEMGTGARIKAEAESGDTHVDGATFSNNTFTTYGTIAVNPFIYVGSGFATWHRNISVTNNVFYGVEYYSEVADLVTIAGNQFLDFGETGYPIRYWGSNHRIERNFIDGGIAGILAIPRHDLSAWRRPCTGNSIQSNIVIGQSEEGISFDSNASNGTWTALREYDTVSATPGSSVVTLGDGDWSAQTTYNSSRYDMVFVSGTLAGNRYKITTHAGADFTLDIPGGDYSSISNGDGVSIQLSCYENTIANNFVIPSLASHRANVSGIVFHGIGVDNDVHNNVVYGESDGVGDGDTNFTKFALREANLNSVDSDGSITGNQRRGPVGPNNIVSNRSFGGGVGSDYRNYASSPDFTPPSSTYTDNSEITRAAAKLAGGTSPTTAEGFKLSPYSPLIGAGTCVYTTGCVPYDYGGRRARAPADIGAWQRNAP